MEPRTSRQETREGMIATALALTGHGRLQVGDDLARTPLDAGTRLEISLCTIIVPDALDVGLAQDGCQAGLGIEKRSSDVTPESLIAATAQIRGDNLEHGLGTELVTVEHGGGTVKRGRFSVVASAGISRRARVLGLAR
jgi:hypothetical protein